LTLSSEKLPAHIAVIMDGNGRWAQSRGLPRSEGHKAGAEAARTVVTACRRLGIPYLTLYAFSKENWSRPEEEVRLLFDLMLKFIRKELDSLVEHSIRLQVLGDFDGLPFAVRQALRHAMARTRDGSKLTLNVALNYSGRDEIARAVQALVRSRIPAERITPEMIADQLDTRGQPDPDLLIRTSGELRISNFLIFQLAYTEFYFTDTLWPDFDEQEFNRALEAFANRNRRFGAAQEQLVAWPQAPTNNAS